jgi:hypothetical protein
MALPMPMASYAMVYGLYMAGPGNDPVQVYRTGRENHWEFLRLWTGFELPSSWIALPDYGSNRNRNILDFMRCGLKLTDFALAGEAR